MAEQVEDYINSVSDPRERRAFQALLDHINERTAIFPLKVANVAVSRTAAEINALLQCSTAQYKTVTGKVGIVATTNVVTGLSSVMAFNAVPFGVTGASLSFITWEDSYEAGRVTIYGWEGSSTAGSVRAANLAAGGANTLAYTAIGAA